MEHNKDAMALLYSGTVILGGTLAGLWAFTANRFTMSESMFIIVGGMLAGIGLGLVCHGVVNLLKK